MFAAITPALVNPVVSLGLIAPSLLWVALQRPQGCLGLENLAFISLSLFFRQATSAWALVFVVCALCVCVRPLSPPMGALAPLFGLAPLAVRGARRAYLFNKGLANGLVMVHPGLVAASYALIALCFLGCYASPAWGPRLPQLQRRLWLGASKLACLALILGAWWAQQELNWGGWWAWDLVELGSLGLLLGCLALLHAGPRVPPQGLVLALAFFFLGLRLGLFSSVHSFVSGGHVGGQLSMALVLLTLLCSATLGWGQPAPRLSLACLVLCLGGLGVSTFFIGDALGSLVGGRLGRSLLWLLPLGATLGLPGLTAPSPLPLALSPWLSFARLGGSGLLHLGVSWSLIAASLLGSSGLSLAQAQLSQDSLITCGESYASRLSSMACPGALGAQAVAAPWLVSYGHTLVRPLAGYSRRLSLVDLVQQSLLCLDHNLVASIAQLSLVDTVLGLSPIALALILKKRA